MVDILVAELRVKVEFADPRTSVQVAAPGYGPVKMTADELHGWLAQMRGGGAFRVMRLVMLARQHAGRWVRYADNLVEVVIEDLAPGETLGLSDVV